MSKQVTVQAPTPGVDQWGLWWKVHMHRDGPSGAAVGWILAPGIRVGSFIASVHGSNVAPKNVQDHWGLLTRYNNVLYELKECDSFEEARDTVIAMYACSEVEP